MELAFLVLLNRLMNWGRAPVIATRAIAADAEKLRALVSDPAAERRIIDGVGLRVPPRAHVEPSRSDRVVTVRLTLGRRDLLWLTWILSPNRGTTEVDLAAQLPSRALLARLLMVLGGRRWLRHRLEDTLRALAAVAHIAAEDVADVERASGFPRRSGAGAVRAARRACADAVAASVPASPATAGPPPAGSRSQRRRRASR